MYIKSFEYKNLTWDLDTIYLNRLNLIVGKNAVGKSKTLKALVDVAKFINGETAGDTVSHQCRIVFEKDNDKEIIYSYEWSDKIIKETMMVNDEVIISRDKNQTLLKGDVINPPTNKLVIQTQRDTNLFPEFETIINWAEHVRGFSFSDLTAFHSYTIPTMFPEKLNFDELYERIDKEKRDFIIDAMRELGYKINSIQKLEFNQFKIIYLVEDGVNISLHPFTMSNGMLRVFYILTYMAYIATVEGAKTFLVDDLGEGLDFSRSSKLSKIMFDYCENNDIQLIVTSNDKFLMNTIDLNNWIILQRTGSKVSSYSNITHKDMFIKFRKMGLNNFDILGTDFVERFISDSSK